MKKRKNKSFFVALIILISVLLIGGIVWYKLYTRDVYILDIPNSYNLSSIVYEKDSGIVTLYEEEDMDRVLNGLHNLDLETQNVSVQDYPSDVDVLTAIRFNYREDAVGTLYLYKKNNKYYLEEAYNGVYKLTEEEYKYIINLGNDEM